MSATLDARPKSTQFKVTDLLAMARSGQLRIPRFQRPIRWGLEHNLALFDSLIAGYPVGSLLFWQRSAPAERLVFGGFSVDAAARDDAWYVVDGQQRLTALIGTLCHPDPLPASIGDPYDLYYDLEGERVVPRGPRTPPSTWAPLRELADPRLAWLHKQAWSTTRQDLVDRALDVSVAIRDTEIPAYIVKAQTDAPLRVIFKRLNTSGVGMRDHEVFDALHGLQDSSEGTLRGVSAALDAFGMGALDEPMILKALFAVRSVDPRRRNADELEALAAPIDLQATAAALRRVLEFLRDDAGIPGLALLPYQGPLVVLARFFHFFPRPHPRSRRLLRRWFWRGCLSGRFRDTSNPAIRRQLVAVQPDDEHGSVQALLLTAPREATVPPIDGQWRADRAASRVVTLALMSLRPREVDGRPVDLAKVAAGGPKAAGVLIENWPSEACNRVLLSPSPPLEEWSELPEVIGESHAVGAAARAAAAMRDVDGFMAARRAELAALVAGFGDDRAEWGESDRPPLAVLVEAG